MQHSRITTSVVALALAAGLGSWTHASAPAPEQAQGQAQGGRGGGAGAQTPVRDSQGQLASAQAATGVIAGTIRAENTGAPVRRARVSISGPELRGGRSTITNDEGVFVFTALPVGRFTITASKAGYLDIPYGAKKPGRPGTAIQLAAGQKVENISIGLPRGGVITGIVVDDVGEPAPGTPVRIFRYVMRTGERTLQQAGQAQTDDRGLYRVYGLQPGEYLVSAMPRNVNTSDLRQAITSEIEMLLQQIQQGGLAEVLGGRGGGGAGMGGGGRGGGRAGGMGGIDIQQMMGGRGGDLMARAQQLQQQLSEQDEVNQAAYAPVYFPGTASPATATPVTLGISEERAGVDFRLMLVPTAHVRGSVTSPDGQLPQGVQLTLTPLDQIGGPNVPGSFNESTRVNQQGQFTFDGIPPGQYRVMARGVVRQVDATAGAQAQAGQGGRGGQGRGGPGGGGRGGPGQIAQVLWGYADVTVAGQDIGNVTVALQQGMTVSGRITFDSTTNPPPSDLTNVRVNLSPRGTQQSFELGGVPPATVDAGGRFTIRGVVPGRYTLTANVAGAGFAGGRGGAAGGAAAAGGRGGAATTGQSASWVLKSALANGRDALDFGLVIEPNQDVAGATVVFTDKTQELTGVIQDTLGRPTAEYTIILFAADKAYWTPQARRIQMARPATDGRFTFRGLPAGDYRLTAVTDVEQGEWFDPAFLEQLINASIPVSLREGERKTQDIKVAASGG